MRDIDPDKIEKKITPKPRAIIVVHLYGQSADMDSIVNIAKENILSL
jgi:UDP-2-acetamido-2-deoxy-ribo-hexuluronate aminotransferase